MKALRFSEQSRGGPKSRCHLLEIISYLLLMTSFERPQAKTSLTHPLRIDNVSAPGGGLIGMTFCPGKKQQNAMTGAWDRDLKLDLERVRALGAVAVVTLMENHELAKYQVEHLGLEVKALGIEWHHLPIRDWDVPREPFEERWLRSGPKLRNHLAEGRRILLHCLGGLGRTGTIAVQLLAELGRPAQSALEVVRQARHGAVETEAQRAYALAVLPITEQPIADGNG